MKKQFIVMVLFASLVLNTVQAHAQDLTSATDATSPVNAVVPVNTEVPSVPEYTITIPTNIDIGGNLEATYDVTVKGNTTADMVIQIRPDDVITMESDSGTETVDVYQGKTRWVYEDITAENGTTTTGKLNAERLTEGTWTGNLSFSIDLQYVAFIPDDESKQVITWDELLENNWIKYDSSSGQFGINYSFKSLVPKGHFVIPDFVKSINYYSYDSWYGLSCSNLTAVTIPNSVTSINGSAFYNCTNLKSIKFPNSITVLTSNVCKECTNLESIEIPSTVTTISSQAFCNCTSLQSVKVPDSVKVIESDAFKGVGTVYYSGIAEGAPWGANKVLPYKEAP